MSKALPSPQQLRAMLDYNPETGLATWRKRDDASARFNGRFAGKPALRNVGNNGYRRGTVLGCDLLLHRVAWAIFHGAWPTGQIDHVNGDRLDNRITNLRDVSSTENNRNHKRRCTNTSGFMGVYWHPRDKKWVAQIRVARTKRQLGSFAKIEDAVAARKAAELTHGFHENHGRIEFPLRGGSPGTAQPGQAEPLQTRLSGHQSTR